MWVLIFVVTLLHVFEGSDEVGSRHRRITHGRQNLFLKNAPYRKPGLLILNLNDHINNNQPNYWNWNDLKHTGSFLRQILFASEEPNKDYTKEDTYCEVIANENSQHIREIIELFQPTLSNNLRSSNDVLLCERNCSQQAAKMCHSCIDATLKVLAYSCIRKCQLTKGEREYLHDEDVHPGPEYMCKKKREEHARCCKGNCYRSIFKRCWFKKVRLCTRETVQVLKSSCHSKCERGSNNPYLNAFCSFVFKYKKVRRPIDTMNMSSTYFWENVGHTPYPMRGKRQPVT